MPHRFRFATCNEVFENWTFHDTCKAIRRAGYQGLEIAPFTLAADPASLTPDQRRQFRSIMQSEDLVFVGLHWLLVKPDGLHVTTNDTHVRTKSWQYIRDLIDLCADLGDAGVMVFGSPKQRSAVDGASVEEATARFVDGIAGVSSQAAERGVTILIEALPSAQSNVVTSLDEAARIVREIASPSVRTMFDTHNAVEEMEAHATLIERHFDLIRHVHVNEMDGRHPGTGTYDFKPMLSTLLTRDYRGWVSLEAFDFSAGAETIVRDTIAYLKSEVAAIAPINRRTCA